ncbi:N-acetyl-gamma-glutamyl-phosphate reductase [Bogoriella caseilytica]|uniref:N-acetyl-gamma-glutamyl-phosphate reductase n=2 Tax=Bogoriella caseilytica TaxID=56055 RepID=A0A3N2BG21_9MICO|nr:N-acetyl-gamma-glutamyl-phosphate reductase [Bogoriella caseilytica]
MVMRVSFSVAVAGASGYAGGEVLRLLLNHPDVRIGALTAHSSAGDRLGVHQPHLPALADRVIEPTSAGTLAGHDVVVLALPHGASGELADALSAHAEGAGPLIIDCGADHRLISAEDWQRFYGSDHAGTWPYGMPELLTGSPEAAHRQREDLRGARRIAVPGCNATAVTLALQPGVAAEIIDPGDIVAALAVGYSGAGKSLKPHLLASEAAGNLQPYGVGGTHRHIPEIAQNLRSASNSAIAPRISFTPMLAPVSRGILATVTAPLTVGDANLVRQVWTEHWEHEPFVDLLPAGTWPSTAAVSGTNRATVQVALDSGAGGAHGRVVAMCALDNLGKGTAGAAIQSMNLALGLPETTGLPTTGVAP